MTTTAAAMAMVTTTTTTSGEDKMQALVKYLEEHGIPASAVSKWRAEKHPQTNRTWFITESGQRIGSIPSAANFISPPLERWLDSIRKLPDPVLREQVLQYHKVGYLLLKQVFDARVVDELLNGFTLFPQEEQACPERGNNKRPRRACKTSSALHIDFLGAKRLIARNRMEGGLGVLAERGRGRYDLPLPQFLLPYVQARLRSVFTLLEQICPRGGIKTCNVMLSAPGSERQEMHTDSASQYCGGGGGAQPPHYVTVLIPLTQQDAETGMTQVWPGSHRRRAEEEGECVEESLCPELDIGDALVFDGLLAHLGTANTSLDRARYFFYMAYSAKKTDPNTELTGDW